MPEIDQITPEDLFEFILARLGQLQATGLIDDIKQSIESGVVTEGQFDNSKHFRPMNPEERLALLLELVISALAVPVMLHDSSAVFDCHKITLTAGDREDQNFDNFGFVMEQAESEKLNRRVLSKFVKVCDDLGFAFPEVV